MSIPVGFSPSDFFYNNVNAPLQYNDPSNSNICDLSGDALRDLITNYFSDLSFNVPVRQPTLRPGQCSIVVDTSGKNTATDWKLVYTRDKNGRQRCSCEKTSSTSFVPMDSSTFQSETYTQTTQYRCTPSSTRNTVDNGANELPDEPDGKIFLINKSVEYYKLVCENERLANELKNSLSKNLDGDLKYDDSLNTYNKEYLNKVNLGIGIVCIIGLILFSLNSKPPSASSQMLKLPEPPVQNNAKVMDTPIEKK